jgi:hypothetical protein
VLIDHTSWPFTATVPLSGASTAGNVQQGRLACSRWSGHDDEFACIQREVEVDEHVHMLVAPAVRLADVLELEYRRHTIDRHSRHS